MYDELTKEDIQKMQEEIDYRVQQLRPKLIEDVQTARAFGDLSENFEYKCAKQEKNRNDSRIRYLQRMIKTAKVIGDKSTEDTAGLYDTVEILMENTGRSRTIQLVTTLRQDALKGWISKESPVRSGVCGDGEWPGVLSDHPVHHQGQRRRLDSHRQLLRRNGHDLTAIAVRHNRGGDGHHQRCGQGTVHLPAQSDRRYSGAGKGDGYYHLSAH